MKLEIKFQNDINDDVDNLKKKKKPSQNLAKSLKWCIKHIQHHFRLSYAFGFGMHET